MYKIKHLYKIVAATCAAFLLLGNLAPAIAVINVTEKNLTTSNNEKAYWPEISGNYVVYSDSAAGPSTVYLYDIAAETTTEIGRATGSNENPAIDGDRVVYSSYDGEAYSIRMYTISTHQDIEITPVTHDSSRPAISGDHIVYRNGPDPRRGNNIYLIDLNDVALTPLQISDAYADNFRPEIDGNFVVWHADNGSDNNVMLYDIQESQESEIANTPDDEERPDVSGDYVVYHLNAGNDGVCLYKISDHKTSLIVQPSYSYTPRIQGNFVVYEGGLTDGAQKVILRNLTTGVETTIAEPGDFLDIPVIDGRHVAWVSNGGDIMLDTLSSPPVFAALPGSNQTINLTPGQIVTANPYTIQVHPTSDFGIDRVEFYIDGVLIGTSTTPDANGVYSMNWDTSLYHSTVRVIAYSTTGESAVLADVTVQTQLPYTGR